MRVQQGKRELVTKQKEDKLSNMRSIEQQNQEARARNRALKMSIKRREEELRLKRQAEEDARRRRQQAEYVNQSRRTPRAHCRDALS